MCNRYNQVDVSYAVATNLFLGYFNTTTVTNYTLVSYTFIFTTGTFVILYRSEYTLTEKSVTLWFVRTVVNRFRF